MISRNLTTSQINALLSDEVASILFVDIDAASGPVRAHTGLGERPFAGVTYQGIGEFGGIGDVVENEGDSPAQLNLTLKMLDSTVIAMVMNEELEGREVAVHLALLDENKRIEHEIPHIFDGNITKGTIKRGDVAKQIPYILNLTCGDWLDRWNQPADNARTTNAAQQDMHPGDRIFDLTEIIASAPLSSLPIKRTWPIIRPWTFG